MASCDSLTQTPTPEFINFLFSSKLRFDCYFEVGNNRKPERIGAVKLMLMAHSEVFRAELEYEKNVPIEDVHPKTFKGMLRYVYGNDTTQDMCFDEADNLLYVAEKYMIKTLKDKLATRLMQLLNTDNICSLLNNPACYTHLELNSAITDILRYETDRILASPQFVWMNADGFRRILEQDGLAVPELELWRAAIRWAKLKANSEDGQQLRQELSGLTQHLRPCALTVDEICGEIADSQVLTMDEVGIACLSVTRKEKPKNLKHFSNETEPRKRTLLRRNEKGGKKKMLCELPLANLNCEWYTLSETYNFTLLTRSNKVELSPLKCKASPAKPQYVECTTTVTKSNSHDPASSFVVSFRTDVDRRGMFDIPLTVDGRTVTMQPDTEYKVQMVLRGGHKVCYNCIDSDSDDSDSGDSDSDDSVDSGIYESDHLTLVLYNQDNDGGYRFEFPCTKLQYRVVTTVE